MISKNDIQGLFGDLLGLILKDDLREMVVQAFVLACQRGGYGSVEQLQAMPFTLLTPTRGLNFIEHTMAVTWGAMGLAEGQAKAYRTMPYTIDIDRLIAGALLHDVGKIMEIEPDGKGGYRKSHMGRCARHPISGAGLLMELSFPPEIVNIVACHAKEGEGRPQVVETILIHQADFATFDPLVMKDKGTLIE